MMRIPVVRADAAYFNYAFLSFICDMLHASVSIDYNLISRRRGVRAATRGGGGGGAPAPPTPRHLLRRYHPFRF